MCGIAGIFRFDSQKVEAYEVKKLTDSIAHRGPDGEGVWINKNGNLGLGHRRLSILDLSENAAQPMHYADGKLTIVYNGEIFNFAELREELKIKGYHFHTDSDTEVLLAAYHAWGKDCLYKFNGFWAFALWDHSKKELWLARDRFGIKPLYYLFQKGKQFVFGSETSLFKHIEGFKKEADDAMVCYNIQNGWGIEGLGKTIFKEIEQIRPGHYLIVKPNGEMNEVQWWKTSDHLVSVPLSYNEQIEKFKNLFEDAVRIRLRSDVSIASALSGGLDSSSIFTSINHFAKAKEKIYRLPKEWQKAFVAIFPGTEQDEREYADAVLKHINGEALYVNCNDDKNLLSNLIASIKYHDSISATPLFILDSLYAAMKHHQITVSIDGHGVDEMMYGYPFNVLNAYGHQLQHKTYAKEIKEIYLNMIPEDEQQIFKHQIKFHNRLGSYIKRKKGNVINKFSPHDSKQQWFDINIKKCIHLPNHAAPQYFKGSEAQLYHDFHFTTLPTILRNFDRGSMRNGVEIRMPFLDYRLVSYIFSLSMQSKLGNGFTKRILRDAMKEVLPEVVRTRKLKTGFNAPLKSWFQKELKEFILDEVSSAEFLASNIWNGKVIKDDVISKTKSQTWTTQETMKFWPLLNAYILLKK